MVIGKVNNEKKCSNLGLSYDSQTSRGRFTDHRALVCLVLEFLSQLPIVSSQSALFQPPTGTDLKQSTGLSVTHMDDILRWPQVKLSHHFPLLLLPRLSGTTQEVACSLPQDLSVSGHTRVLLVVLSLSAQLSMSHVLVRVHCCEEILQPRQLYSTGTG